MTRAAADVRADAEAIFSAAVSAVLPETFLPAHLPPPPVEGRLVLMAAGKAAGSMARATEAHYFDTLGFDPARLTGLSIARHGYGVAMRVVEQLEAGHPVPDAPGLAATARLMALAEACTADDLVVFLLSGGASANLIAPAGAITLEEKQALTKQLLRAGVPIDQINTVRKHISRVKGGRLARLIAPARIVTLALSDVPRDDLSAIGSGPTIPDPTTLADARAVLERFGIVPPRSVAAELGDPANETPKPDDPVFRNTHAIVAARPRDAFEAAKAKATALGYAVLVLAEELEGEARMRAAEHAAIALAHHGKGERIALLSGGELTVTIRGNGRGGPNQEYALALAIALNGASGITALAGDTDGTDGGIGDPRDPAGAFIDEMTLARAATLGLDAQAMLDNNDSTRFFATLGDLHQPGPTLTNANDLRIILING
jgi:hydroxypyruvate reductase